jgi:oxygen-independent coproporphyrinogen-3 oxidase
MQNVAGSIDVVDAARRLEEAWFLGLRRNLGVNASEVRREFGEAALEMEESASVLVEDGLLEYDGGVYRLTPRGRMISNDVFARFVTETGPVYA